jgi:hypothetical protein
LKVKTKIVLFGVVLIGVISLISVGIFYKAKYKSRVKENISSLDSIQYVSLDSSLHEIIPSDNYKVIFFFDSDCDHCQAEALVISENISRFANADVYFFSKEELHAISKFANEFGLAKIPDIKIGQVDFNHVILKMGVITYPMCFIYSREGKLLKKYVGEVSPEAVIKYLQ